MVFPPNGPEPRFIGMFFSYIIYLFTYSLLLLYHRSNINNGSRDASESRDLPSFFSLLLLRQRGAYGHPSHPDAQKRRWQQQGAGRRSTGRARDM
jgi:hypothetical protein